MSYQWHDLAGNAGVVLIVGAYLLLQLRRLDAAGVAYSLVNGVGAALVLLSLTQAVNLSGILMQVFWLVISGVGLARALSRQGISGSEGPGGAPPAA